MSSLKSIKHQSSLRITTIWLRLKAQIKYNLRLSQKPHTLARCVASILIFTNAPNAISYIVHSNATIAKEKVNILNVSKNFVKSK